jgi:hypothetical protein
VRRAELENREINIRVVYVDVSGRMVLGQESAAIRELVYDLLSKDRRRFCSILPTCITSTARVWVL